MIEKMLEKIRPNLPLKISTINWDETQLHMFGENWSFYTLSAWRLIEGNKMVLGCADSDSIEQSLSLNDMNIIEVNYQESRLRFDPAFKLSNNQVLEIFSTDVYEPWTFSIESICFFWGTPGDPNVFCK